MVVIQGLNVIHVRLLIDLVQSMTKFTKQVSVITDLSDNTWINTMMFLNLLSEITLMMTMTAPMMNKKN